MEGANRTARVILQVIEIRCVVALIDSFEQSEMDFHQVFDPVEDAPDVFRIEMARHLLDCAIHDQVNVQLGTYLSDSSSQSYSVVPGLQRTAFLRQMLLEVSAQGPRA